MRILHINHNVIVDFKVEKLFRIAHFFEFILIGLNTSTNFKVVWYKLFGTDPEVDPDEEVSVFTGLFIR